MKRSIEDTPIVFIGAGNLATNLAKALYRKGFRIVQIYSRTMESARTLAEKVEAEYTTDLQAVSKDAKLYIVSLKRCRFSRFATADNRRKAGVFVGAYGRKHSDEHLGRACRTLRSILSDADIQQTA